MTAQSRVEKQLPAVLYARYSTDRQDARSIDDQLRRCRAHARERGYEVIAEYDDKAQSGAHSDRASLQKMLEASRKRGGSPFRAVIVDDLSRLSRDLGNTWRIVFEDLASANVKVIDATTGMSSDGAGARLTFGAMALVNDTFLELVRTETHRGLEGRAIDGFWTGGRVYGYDTIKEPDPPDPEHPRAIPVINEQKAEMVRKVFRLYLDGVGLGKIAAALNADHVPAPYDGTYSKPAGKGWGQSTVRSMLLNERYAGRFVWNKRKWLRVPGRKSKRCIFRPEAEWVVTDVPGLALVTKEVWQLVQARFRERKSTGRGRAYGEGNTPHLLSGLLRCGACGSRMSVVSSNTKAGHRYSNFGCSARHSKGAEVCGNHLVISELKANEAVVDAVRDMVSKPRLIERFVRKFNERVAAGRSREETGEAAKRDREIAQAEKRVKNITTAVAAAGWSSALADQLKAEERALESLRARRRQASSTQERSQVVLHPTTVESFMTGMLELLEKSPERGRLLLKSHLGAVVMTPRTEGGQSLYEATGAFDLFAVANLGVRNSSAPVAGGRVCDWSSCGGPQVSAGHARTHPQESSSAVKSEHGGTQARASARSPSIRPRRARELNPLRSVITLSATLGPVEAARGRREGDPARGEEAAVAGSTDETTSEREAHLRQLAQRHRTRFEVRPETHVAGHEMVPIGFELELYGIHEHKASPGPGCPGCTRVYRALREIAEWLLQCEDRGARYEIGAPDGALHEAPDMRDLDEVRLELRIVHRHDYFAPIDASEERCLGELKGKLRQLGMPEGRRRS